MLCEAQDRLRAARVEPAGRRWVEAGDACDIHFADAPKTAREALEGMIDGVDVVVQPAAERSRLLLVTDMDSTVITVECIDELADYAGVKAEVAAVTEQAMRGELDFAAALRARVALLRGLDAATVDRCHAERVRLMPGATTLVRTMRARGAYTLLVSGGFTVFADRVAAEIGFDRSIANRLGTASGSLDGTVAEPILGAAAKRSALIEAAAARAVPIETTLAVGDGANDAPMLAAAGLGVAYHAKPAAEEAAGAVLRHADLDALLYAQGIPRRDWVS